jgi:hypothetical protein
LEVGKEMVGEAISGLVLGSDLVELGPKVVLIARLCKVDVSGGKKSVSLRSQFVEAVQATRLTGYPSK